MTMSVAVILCCMLAGLAAAIGVVVQAWRHGSRLVWGWLLLPGGAVLAMAFIPGSIAFQEGVWGARDPRLWMALAVGAAGVLLQVLGWRAVLRARLLPTQCPSCEYFMNDLPRCPECGRPAEQG